jgi:hypothetical protein
MMNIAARLKEVDLNDNRPDKSFKGTHLVPKSVNAPIRLPSLSK